MCVVVMIQSSPPPPPQPSFDILFFFKVNSKANRKVAVNDDGLSHRHTTPKGIKNSKLPQASPKRLPRPSITSRIPLQKSQQTQEQTKDKGLRRQHETQV